MRRLDAMRRSRHLPFLWLAVLASVAVVAARPNPGDILRAYRAKGLRHGLSGRQLIATPADTAAPPTAPPLTVPIAGPGSETAISETTPTLLPSAHPPSPFMPSPMFLLPPDLPSVDLPPVLPSSSVSLTSVPSMSLPSAGMPPAALPTPVPNTTDILSTGVPSARVPVRGTAPTAALTISASAGVHPTNPSSDAVATPDTSASSTTPELAEVLMTPSPSFALPIRLQSQVITTYSPQVTICQLAPLAYSNVSNGYYPATGTNASYPATGANASRPTGTGFSSLRPATISCSTLYSAMTTNICSTMLTGGGQLLTVTDCTQDVTFSTDHGYNLSTSAMLDPMSVIRKGNVTTDTSASTSMPITYTTYAVPTTTYYLAPWQDVAAGIPTQVQAKICSPAPDGGQDCTSVLEKWVVTTVAVVQSFTNTITLTTTLSGGTRVIIDKTSTIDITETLTTIDISTELPGSSTVSLPSVSTSVYTLARETLDSTDYVTYTLESVTATTELHTTITLTSTSTTYVTLPRTTVMTSSLPKTTVMTSSMPKPT